MKFFLEQLFRSADGGGAGGGGEGASPPAADTAAPPAPGGEGGADVPAAGAPYRPDGLSEQYHGETDTQTIDRLMAAMAERNADVPEDIAAYRDYGDVSDELKPYYQTIENDGLFDAVANKAKDLGVTKTQLNGILGAYMNGAQEMGLLEPAVDVAAERSALLPDAAKALPKADQDRAIDRRMNDNLGWLDQMVQRGLPADSAKHMSMMLGDTADGHKAIEFFRSQMTGASEPKPQGGGDGATSSAKDDLRRRAALPENTPGDPKFDKQSYLQLETDYRKVYPD